jgi:ribosomal protein S18 acetylase RimI-like enzyme
VSPAPSIRRLARHEWREYRDLRLRALADSPSAFSTTLVEAQARADADWSHQVASGSESPFEIALVAEMDSRLVGLAWSRIDPSAPDRAFLYQLWVEPELRRRGAGRRLLGAAIRWATSANARAMVLSVTCGEMAAIHLYESAGFEPFGALEPLRVGSERLVQPMQLDLRAS